MKLTGPAPARRWGRSHWATEPDGDGTLGQVVGVVSSGGGAGSTWISVNLALSASEGGLGTALMDADPSLGTVASLLGLNEERSLAYLGHEAALRPIDEGLVERHLQRYRRLAVLAGRSEPGPPAPDHAVVFDKVATLLSARFSLVMADIGAATSPAAVEAAASCHLLLWVVDASVLGAERLDRCLSASFNSRLRSKPSLALLNRVGSGVPARARNWLAGEYGMRLIGEIGDSPRATRLAEEALVPSVVRGQLAQSLRAAANNLEAVIRQDPSAGPDRGRLPLAAISKRAREA